MSRPGDDAAVGVVLQLDGSDLLVGQKSRGRGSEHRWLVLQHCWSSSRSYCRCARGLGDSLAVMGSLQYGVPLLKEPEE